MANLYNDAAAGLLSPSALPSQQAAQQAGALRWIGGPQMMGENILRQAMAMGYGGGQASPTDLRQLAQLLGISDLEARAQKQTGSWQKDGDISKRDAALLEELQQEYQFKQLNDWAQANGLSIQGYDTGNLQGQNLVGADGKTIANDQYNLGAANKGVDAFGAAAMAAVLAPAFFAGAGATPAAGSLPSGGGIGGIGGSMSGGAYLPGAAYNPGIANTIGSAISSNIGGGSLLGGIDIAGALGSGLGSVATGGAGATLAGLSPLGAAGLGAGIMNGAGGAGAVGGAEAASLIPGATGVGITGAGMSSADKAALLGADGYGAGMTGAQTGAFDTVLGATGSTSLANLAAGGVGALGGLGNAIGGIANAVGGAKNLAGIVGGIAGAVDGGKDQTSTTSQQIDPRMAQYLYGTGYGDKNSLLGAAQDWWKNNQSGMNANMAQGLDTLKSLYTSPGYTQGYTQMRDVGQGLLGRQIAGNPFTQGGLLGAPAQGQQAQMPKPDIGVPQTNMQAPSLGLLQGQMPSPDIGLQKFNRPAWSI